MKDKAQPEIINPFSMFDVLTSSTQHFKSVANRKQRTIGQIQQNADHAGDYLRDVQDVINIRATAARDNLAKLGKQQTETAQAAQGFFKDAQAADLSNYLVDVWQRWVLFTDVLRRRGNNFVQQEREGSPPVLVYDYDIIIDGRTLERPVNYSLVAIRPPAGVTICDKRRPYIIIDPRAGQGSGIGGFKHESEVGVALQSGHPVYFCIFTTHPTPTQTVADVTRAEAEFVRQVRRLHPESAKPVIIGNCQGGWAAMLLAATNTDLTGPIVINGAPLSYWAGVRGKNPMRYMGGLLGGIAPTLMMADLGNGKFDGANLIFNFEMHNPGATWWKKNYDLFNNIEDEAEEFLKFERWWSGFYFMSEAEIRWIVENLFVGNKLVRGGAQLDSRKHVDLRNIRAPIIVFASHGDYITPPPQALNWISDIYSDVKEIKARGQKIVYTIHDNIGHLGIFVSATVANKQHKEIVSTLKTIESMTPGLYEMIITEESGEGIDKHFSIAFEERSIDDIRAMNKGYEDESAFAAAARISRFNTEMYDLTLRPMIKAVANENTARTKVNTHPLRTQRYLLSDLNPFLKPLASLTETVTQHRLQNSRNNPFYKLETLNADLVTGWINIVRDMRDSMVETMFTSIYSSPFMRRLAESENPRISEVAGTDVRSISDVSQALEEATRGGLAVAVIRMLILLAHARKSVRRDRLERSNELLSSHEPFASIEPDILNRIIHQQSLIVTFETELALATLPALVQDPKDRDRTLELCKFVVGPPEEMNAETTEMLRMIHVVLNIPQEKANNNRRVRSK